jgi:hypothetical protein
LVNVILQFKENKKGATAPLAFYNKKVCFVTKDSVHIPKPGEYWECFLWVEKEKYNLVKTFKKIEPELLESETKRVTQFNEAIEKLKAIQKKEKDFDKVIFSEDNKPYLLSTKPLTYLKEKYKDYIIIKKEDKKKWLRPILTPEDRKEYQKQVL